MPQNKVKTIWIIAALTGSAIAAALLLWIVPQTRLISSEITALQQERAEIDSWQKKTSAGTALKSFDSYQAGQQQLKDAAVTESSVISLIETLEKMAGETGVSTQFSVQDQSSKKTTPAATATPDQKNPAAKNQAQPNDIKLQLTLSGSWANLLAMLKKIENLPAVISVTDLSFRGTASAATAPADLKTVINTSQPTASLSLTIPLFN